MNLDKLLKPRSIAVIGASEKSGFSGDTCKNILEYTKDLSRVYFVNPKRDQVFGVKCYKDVGEIDDSIDLAIICTPQSVVNMVLKQAAEKGCGGAVVFASGYSEIGPEGKALQQELVDLAEEYGIALMGPNCAGFANYIDDVFSFAFLTEKRDRKGHIGMISQSGQICLSALDHPNVGFSCIISSGNSSNVKTEDYLNYLVEDEDTKVVGAYLEGIVNIDVFTSALKKATQKRKPVVILKSGRSEKSSELVSSHTGSLSGSDKAIDAVFEKYGVIRVDDIQELITVCNVFATLDTLPTGTGYAVLNVSGGEASIAADLADLNSIDIPDLSEEAKSRLAAFMPGYATPNNPLDMTATLAYDSENLANSIAIFAEQDSISTIIIAYTLTPEIIDTTSPSLIEGIRLAKEAGVTKPILWLPYVEHTKNRECANDLYDLHVPILSSGMSGFKILASLDRFARYDSSHRTLESYQGIQSTRRERIAHSESESFNFLIDAGMQFEKQHVATSEEDVKRICSELGFPVVCKIDSPDILHKSDVGGVRINITNDGEALDAYRQILSNSKHHCPDASVNGVLIKAMAEQGLEMIIGVKNDPQFGPLIMVGLGGVFVEIFKDVKLYPAPVSREEARKMLKSLKGYPLLNGYRGGTHYDVDAFVDLLVDISDFAVDHRDEVLEMDFNPIFLYEEGFEVVDALIITAGKEE